MQSAELFNFKWKLRVDYGIKDFDWLKFDDEIWKKGFQISK